MHDLNTCVTIDELIEINALLDMKHDIQEYQMQKQEQQIQRNSR